MVENKVPPTLKDYVTCIDMKTFGTEEVSVDADGESRFTKFFKF